MAKEFIEILDVILRCLVSLITLFFVTKMIGKKQVSQFSLFDYVIGISIGNFAAEMALNLDSDYMHGIVAVIVFGVVAYLVSVLTLKNLKRTKFDINDLLEECRINGYFDISEIDYALMEANGKISFLPKTDYQKPTNKDLNIKKQKTGLCANLIIDGQIIHESLRIMHKDENWLKHEIKVKGYKLEDIILATLDLEETFKIYGKNVNSKAYDILN